MVPAASHPPSCLRVACGIGEMNPRAEPMYRARVAYLIARIVFIPGSCDLRGATSFCRGAGC
jgi:hypothetical protein